MLKFEINSQNLKLVEKPSRDIVEDQLKYMKINFVFDETWNDLNKLLQLSQRVCNKKTNKIEEQIRNINLGNENNITIDFPPNIQHGELSFTVLGRITHNEEDKVIYDRKVITTTYSLRITKSFLNQDSLEETKDNEVIYKGADKFFIFDQLVSSSEWMIQHNLEKYPSVTILDSAGTNVIGDVVYIDNNNLKIIFSSKMSGKAYLN